MRAGSTGSLDPSMNVDLDASDFGIERQRRTDVVAPAESRLFGLFTER